jgi:eukaryotic-like serine/threonine-protein kinase
LWAQTYPRDAVPLDNLAGFYRVTGRYDKRLAANQETLRLHPANGLAYAYLVSSYLNLNRLQEARATAEEAQAKNFDSLILRRELYHLAFLNNDEVGMAQQLAWAAGNRESESLLLAEEAKTAAYYGMLRKARDYSCRAVASIQRAEEHEVAASYEADAALREALFGNAGEAREHAAAAVGPLSGWGVKYSAALALAFAGDTRGAQAIADDLAKRFPDGTVVQFNYIPTLRGQFALNDHDASRAITVLQIAVPNELGHMDMGALYPVYVRGKAYLTVHQGKEAVNEFQKILDHRGIVLNEPIAALAHLQLGRAYALLGDTGKARAAYQDFLTLWKDADPDIPILVVAKSEYAKLK